MSTGTTTDKTIDLSIDRNLLMQAIKDVSGGLPNRAVQPILQNIYIETTGDKSLLFRATDLDLWVETNIDGTVKTSGAITLPGRKFQEIISRLPDEIVSISGTEDEATILCKRSNYKLATLPADDFPRPNWDKFDGPVTVDADALQYALSLTVFAAASYDMSSILGGILLSCTDSKLECTATDGSRLSHIERSVDDEGTLKALIPAKACSEMIKLLGSMEQEVTLSVSGNELLMTTDSHSLSTRLISGDYPKYQELFPKDVTTTAEINREELLRGLDRAAILSDSRTNLVKLMFEEDTLHINANTPELGRVHEEVAVTLDGPGLELACNNKYLLEVLSRLDSELLKIEMTGSLKPMILRADDHFKYLVMPVQAR